MTRPFAVISLVRSALTVALLGASGVPAQAPDLSGLWAGVHNFGPEVGGTLMMFRAASGWRADLAGFSVPVRSEGRWLSFALPDGKGSFRGRVVGRAIHGHWTQPASPTSSRAYATPVTLEPSGSGRWAGRVAPLESRLTFYLPVFRQPDGAFRTYLRNPESNLGRLMPAARLTVSRDEVSLVGVRGGTETTFAKGLLEDGRITVPLFGRTLHLSKVTDSAGSTFFPRGQPPERYRYTAPVRLDDGWPVATVEEVGISRDAIERFVQLLIDMPMDSLATPQIDGVLIARHGKLVVEEYFHGFHRDMPHDTRSAAKSWTAVLIGAAMQAGVPIRLDTPVYETMLGSVPADLDPGKRAMTLEHLLSMTAGYQCRADATPTANEDVMQNGPERDWYRYTLNIPLISAPGEKIVYCDAEPNLAAGMLQRVAQEPLPEMFDRLVGRPLQMRRYHLQLQPTGAPYGGGGHFFLPRDYMKLPQLMVNDGRWGQRQIVSRDWARRSTAAMRDLSPIQQYGWLWNSLEYAHENQKVRGYFAAGNGGQIFMGVPELDLVIAFTGSNYSQAATFNAQRIYIPQYILPAVSGRSRR